MRITAFILILAGLGVSASTFATETPQQIPAVIQEVYHQDAVYENALYLYLRIAGIFWITVEWIAAIVLWRAYRLLRNAAKSKGFLA